MLQRFALVVDYACTAAFVLVTSGILLGYAIAPADRVNSALLIALLIFFAGPCFLAFLGGKAFRFVVQA